MTNRPAARDYRGLSPRRTRLANGVTVVAIHTRKTPAVTIDLALQAGSAADSPEAPGAMFLLSHLLDRGTASRSAVDIAEELDGRGVALQVSVSRHLVSLVCTCLVEDFAPVLDLVGDLVREPSIPPEELALRRNEALTGLRQDADNPVVRASDGLMAALYGHGHAYGRPLKGTVDSLAALGRRDLLALHRGHFAPSVLSVVVVGDLPESRATDLVGEVFGRWEASVPLPERPPRVRPSQQRRVIVHPMMHKAQAEIAYGFTTIARADPTYYACWLMNNVLGQYAMGGRLGDRIRERQGLAYHVSSSFDPTLIEGPLVVRAGVAGADVDRAIESIDEELAALARDGVTERELAESRQYLVGSLPRSLETNVGIAQFLQTSEFFGLGLDYDASIPGLLAGVSADQVRDAARQHLDRDRATIVVAGPYEER